MIRISELIAKCFYSVWNDVLKNGHTQYWLKGGRNSTKSSFVAITIVAQMMLDAQSGVHSHCVALRKVENTVEGSIFNTFLWAIDMLGVSDYWDVKKNPRTLTYIPTGQTIVFKGCDDPRKIKSIKFTKGYCKYIWYEELDEFYGMEDIRNINQSLMRGGDNIKVFFSYNPPKQIASWVNAEALVQRPDRLVHHSTYLDIPVEWLSKEFLIEAEELKKNNELAYRNEYLGEATGTGGAVFDNIKVETIPDEEIKHYDRLLAGVDFGYAIDPSVYLEMQYDKTKRELYIFNEIYKVGMSNKQLADEIQQIRKGNEFITCDSAEPKSIDELKALGLRTRGAKKGADSVEYGIKFLQHLNKIVIDGKRCPNTAREFSLYEYEKDKFGNFISRYPDANNHSIDSVRYAVEDYTRQNLWQTANKKML